MPSSTSDQRVLIPQHIEPLLRHIGRLADQMHMPAYAVGGCVRDWLLGLEDAQDLDVTVEGNGIDLARAVGQGLSAPVTVHQQFGTATIAMRGTCRRRLDIATCRRETYARPAAYPRVEPGTLSDDLFRRDFTINAMAVVLAPARYGALVDPFHGARDLGMKRLRILHPRSFLDDPSRILRGIRFRHRFGLRWTPQTARTMREALASGVLSRLNAGRLQRELDRMCDEPNPPACFQELAALLQSV